MSEVQKDEIESRVVRSGPPPSLVPTTSYVPVLFVLSLSHLTDDFLHQSRRTVVVDEEPPEEQTNRPCPSSGAEGHGSCVRTGWTRGESRSPRYSPVVARLAGWKFEGPLSSGPGEKEGTFSSPLDQESFGVNLPRPFLRVFQISTFSLKTEPILVGRSLHLLFSQIKTRTVFRIFYERSSLRLEVWTGISSYPHFFPFRL